MYINRALSISEIEKALIESRHILHLANTDPEYPIEADTINAYIEFYEEQLERLKSKKTRSEKSTNHKPIKKVNREYY